MNLVQHAQVIWQGSLRRLHQTSSSALLTAQPLKGSSCAAQAQCQAPWIHSEVPDWWVLDRG